MYISLHNEKTLLFGEIQFYWINQEVFKAFIKKIPYQGSCTADKGYLSLKGCGIFNWFKRIFFIDMVIEENSI